MGACIRPEGWEYEERDSGAGDGGSEKCLRGRVEEVNSLTEGKGPELTPSSVA